MKHRTNKRNKRNARSRQPSTLERSGYFSSEYLRFIKSPQWRAKREQVFAAHGRRCNVCGTTKQLEVDHLRYPSRGSSIQAFINQPIADFQVLCHQHHKLKTAESRSNRNRPRPVAHPISPQVRPIVPPHQPTPSRWWQRVPWEVWMVGAILVVWVALM